MRLVLDTNLVVSGFLWQGTPRQLLDLAIAGEIELFTSPPLLQELQGVLERKKSSGQLTKQALTSEALVLRYAAVAQLITPVAIDSSALRDPDDEQVLACALAARVDLIASGDQDLLAIESFRGIPILPATEAVARVEQSVEQSKSG